MASDGVDESQFKGWQKYYNSYTQQGRVNVFLVTMGGLALVGLYLKLKPKKQAIEGKKK